MHVSLPHFQGESFIHRGPEGNLIYHPHVRLWNRNGVLACGSTLIASRSTWGISVPR